MPAATISIPLVDMGRPVLKPRRPWVARIDGLDIQFDLSRNFVDGKTDYRDADKKGRGAKQWYVLPPGLYEVYHPLPRGELRYFLRVHEDGSHQEVPPSVAKASLQLVFEDLNAATVERVFAVRAQLDGVALPQGGVAYRGLYGGREIQAFWGRKPERGGHLLVATYVMPDHRRKGVGIACIQDAMQFAPISAYTLAPQVYLDLVWSITGERAGKARVRYAPRTS